MATLACDLDFFAPSIPTGLTAIFLPRANVTKTRDVRALGLLLIWHLQFPPLQIPFLLLSINVFFSRLLAQRSERSSDLLGEKLRLFPGREVTALGGFMEVVQRRIGLP